MLYHELLPRLRAHCCTVRLAGSSGVCLLRAQKRHELKFGYNVIRPLGRDFEAEGTTEASYISKDKRNPTRGTCPGLVTSLIWRDTTATKWLQRLALHRCGQRPHFARFIGESQPAQHLRQFIEKVMGF